MTNSADGTFSSVMLFYGWIDKLTCPTITKQGSAKLLYIQVDSDITTASKRVLFVEVDIC